MRKALILFIFSIIFFRSNAQDLSNIREKIWMSQEIYVDQELVKDTLYLYFDVQGNLFSGESLLDIDTLISGHTFFEKFTAHQPGSNQRVASSSVTLDVFDVVDEYIKTFEVIYSDGNNLILESKIKIPGDYYDDGNERNLKLEYRLVYVP